MMQYSLKYPFVLMWVVTVFVRSNQLIAKMAKIPFGVTVLLDTVLVSIMICMSLMFTTVVYLSFKLAFQWLDRQIKSACAARR